MTRVLTSVCLIVACLASAGHAHTQATFETTRVAEGVYQFRWIGHNALFVTTPAGVVVVDPINEEAARQLAQEIRRVAPGSSLVAIVYSHNHPDHATGGAALMAGMGQQNVPIIAHENAVAPIRERGDPAQPVPTVTFSERFAVELGGRRIELHYLGRSHGDDLIVPYIPDVRVAFAVDFIGNDRVGFQALPGWVFPEFFDALAGLLRIPFETVAFGHGPPGDRATVHRQIAYYDDLTAAVRRAIAAGLTEDQAAEQVRLPNYAHWQEYEAWFPMNVRGIYRWLASE